MNEHQFAFNVFELADRIDQTLDDQEVLSCAAALSLVLGTMMADDLVGNYGGFEDIDTGLNFLMGTIRAAYEDARNVQ